MKANKIIFSICDDKSRSIDSEINLPMTMERKANEHLFYCGHAFWR